MRSEYATQTFPREQKKPGSHPLERQFSPSSAAAFITQMYGSTSVQRAQSTHPM
jgi:hypothetical protein